MCLWLKHDLQRHLCGHEKSLSSGQPCHLLADLCLTFSLPVHHNTKHHLDSTTFSKTTLYTEHIFQNLFGRHAALAHQLREMAETRATPLTQVLSPRSLRPKSLRQFLEVLWKTSINYTMYREFGVQDQQAPTPSTSSKTFSVDTQRSHVNYESGGNPRNTSPTSYEPKELATKELATISGSSLEDIYQLYDVQRIWRTR